MGPHAWGAWCGALPLFPARAAGPSFLWTVPWVHLAPNHISAFPTLFDVASLHFAVESFSASLRVVSWVIYTDGGVTSLYPWRRWAQGPPTLPSSSEVPCCAFWNVSVLWIFQWMGHFSSLVIGHQAVFQIRWWCKQFWFWLLLIPLLQIPFNLLTLTNFFVETYLKFTRQQYFLIERKMIISRSFHEILVFSVFSQD